MYVCASRGALLTIFFRYLCCTHLVTFLFLFFLLTSSVGGQEGALSDILLFSFSCSADYKRDQPPPCKLVFLGLVTNALNMRSNIPHMDQNNGDHTLPRRRKLACCVLFLCLYLSHPKILYRHELHSKGYLQQRGWTVGYRARQPRKLLFLKFPEAVLHDEFIDPIIPAGPVTVDAAG